MVWSKSGVQERIWRRCAQWVMKREFVVTSKIWRDHASAQYVLLWQREILNRVKRELSGTWMTPSTVNKLCTLKNILKFWKVYGSWKMVDWAGWRTVVFSASAKWAGNVLLIFMVCDMDEKHLSRLFPKIWRQRLRKRNAFGDSEGVFK